MTTPNQAALDFLLSRRSRPIQTLAAPAPDREALAPILTAALRSPDHGKIEPWRLMVLQDGALTRLSKLAETRGKALGLEPEKTAKGVDMFAQTPLCVAVIASPEPSDKVPEIEQILSAGAVCTALLNAALAAGWGAHWLTRWVSHDRTFVEEGLGLAPHEFVAGLIHIGTETAPPPERPRPDPARKVAWVGE
ncbi:nitroreductase [Defluviimonas sp. 20V17]|uniref:Putative NAD(P)H nitroreductase n=1 Tax=Allgaiera indica TaxID=765699 RepID=A0AAN4ZZI5_9RHOB|nr:nitroreductase family protein [Allgaiera indica]KDB02359.1 nitroreductase [Defluviimonas sp. 20V17]GHE02220.1 nitroreductase [Allgaiera indica]SDX06839.1 Nitroreductase [Allgaiera indica]